MPARFSCISLLFAEEPEIKECCQGKAGCEQDLCAEQLRSGLRAAVDNQGAFAGDFRCSARYLAWTVSGPLAILHG